MSANDEERFAKAVWEVHGAVLGNYENRWVQLVGLKPRLKVADDALRSLPFNSDKVRHKSEGKVGGGCVG